MKGLVARGCLLDAGCSQPQSAKIADESAGGSG